MPGGLSDELASLLSRSTDVNLPYDSREALLDMLLQVGSHNPHARMVLFNFDLTNSVLSFLMMHKILIRYPVFERNMIYSVGSVGTMP